MQKNFEVSKFWHSDEFINKSFDASKPFVYENKQVLKPFEGTHPPIMQERIAQANWVFIYDPNAVKRKLKNRILDAYEELTGKRLFEYKNYKLI